MNKILKYAYTALAVTTLTTSCSDFGDLNVDPEHLNEGNINMALVFSNAEHQALGSDWDAWRNGLIYLSQWNQHLSAGGWWWSYAINGYSNDYAASYWASVYAGGRGALKDAQMCMNYWEGTNPVERAMAEVVRIYIGQRMTDLHGDIPFLQASQPDKYPYPVYDKQEDLYMSMLDRLNECQKLFKDGETSVVGNNDLWYQGDMGKWKKFTNSLLLRVAMRLTKVAPETAKKWAETAYANGCILTNADDCYLAHNGSIYSNDSAEPYAKIISHEDQDVPYISRTFMQVLGNDPRIPLIMSTYPETDGELKKDYIPGGEGIAWCAPEKQQGLPGGVSMVIKTGSSSEASVQWWYPEYTDEMLTDKTSANYYKKTHSRPNHYTYGDWQAPTWVVTAAQTNFLLAEAAYRGWNVGKSASEYYKEGFRAACKQFYKYPNTNVATLMSTYLTDAQIEQYLTDHPYDAANGLKQINEQYWITCFCDEYETYANWRRSGYPELKELCSKFDRGNKMGTYPDGTMPFKDFSDLGRYPKNGDYTTAIVRRFPYPSSETTSNRENLLEALKRQNINNGQTESDFNDSRVWWDKK